MLKISCYENYMLAILRGKKSMKNLREKKIKTLKCSPEKISTNGNGHTILESVF